MSLLACPGMRRRLSGMTDKRLEHEVLHGLSGRGLAVALAGKYLVLACYGAWSVVNEVPTFVSVGSSAFASAWAATVCLLATAALFGVGRTWRTGKFRLEKWTSFFFVIVFLGYSFALIYRAVETENWGAAPLSLIPIAVCILPAVHWVSLVRRPGSGAVSQ